MKYYKVQPNEWITPQRKHKQACCDCGLVHNMTFRIVKVERLNGKRYNKLAIQFKATRNERASAGIRNAKKLRLIKAAIKRTYD